jgi:hypothetical protein
MFGKKSAQFPKHEFCERLSVLIAAGRNAGMSPISRRLAPAFDLKQCQISLTSKPTTIS